MMVSRGLMEALSFEIEATPSQLVMPGLVPGIHVFSAAARKTWMAGTSPAMTA
jgi:hypothetical protein